MELNMSVSSNNSMALDEVCSVRKLIFVMDFRFEKNNFKTFRIGDLVLYWHSVIVKLLKL